MALQGKSIQAKVDLDLEPFATKLSDMRIMLNQLSQGVNIDFGTSKLATQMEDLQVILQGVGTEAEKITTAFNKIEGLSALIENLGMVKSKLEYIQKDIDKINRTILKENESVVKVSESEQRINEIMTQGLSTLQRTNGEIAKTSKQWNGLLSVHRNVTEYLTNENQIMQRSLQFLEEQEALERRKLAQIEEEALMLKQVNMQNEQYVKLLMGGLDLNTEEISLLQRELGLEEQKLGIQKQQTKEIGMQNAERMTGTKGYKGNQLDSPTYLGRRIGSMAVTMLGYQELMDLWNTTTAHINAESQKDYFAKRMNMNAKETQNFTNQLNNMQKTYQKLDMTVVGANALETATKYKVQSDSLGDLTEVMAIYGSEFVKQGRSQEDSILAINDALDGELRRLKEVGIGAEELKATGLWSGDESDKEGMLKALLKISEDRGYDQTAKDITNLSDAITSLEVRIGIDLARAFGIIEPLLRDVIKDFIIMLGWVEQLSSAIMDFGTNFAKSMGLMDKDGNATKMGNFLESWASWFITFGITAYGVYKILKPLVGVFGKLKDVGGGIAKDTGDIAKTGGTVGKDIEQGNFTSEFKKLGKNLGIMARAFIEVAIALVMAWALLKEAMILIEDIGKDWEAHKSEIENGMEFMKKYGVWILGVSAVLVYVLEAMSKTPTTKNDYVNMAKVGLKVAEGLALSMGLIAEAILLLIVPLKAIELLGNMANTLNQGQIDKGISVIRMYGDALHYIEQDNAIGWFIIGLVAVSGIIGFTADTVGVALAVGIASTLLLIAEAIVMLIAPLKAVEMLGGMASSLNEENIQRGSEAIKMVGRVLKALEPSVRELLAIDFEVFGIGLVEKGNQIVNGKGGLQSLTQGIIPNLVTFITDFSNLEIPTTDVSDKVQAIVQMANQIIPLFTAMQNLNNAMGTGGVMGKATTWLGGVMDAHMGTGLKPQLDKLYNDIKDVMEFANKLSGLGTSKTSTSVMTQTATAIAQLKVKLDQFVSTISDYSEKVQGASKTLGNALPNGFKEGSATFGSAVISVLANGITQVQARYPTMKNGGKTLGDKLVDGWNSHKPTLKTSVANEIKYALAEFDGKADDFYNKGKSLGEEMARGFQDGADIHSPGLIARTTARELGYALDALDSGRKAIYQGGVALGQALTNGYNSTGNLRTNVDVLASKGVNSEQLQANVKSVQLNTKGNQQVPQSFNPTFNIDMSNSTIIGIQDLNQRIEEGIDKAMIKYHSPNGAIGY